MNEFAKKLLGHVKTLWGKWTVPQRAILVGIVVVVIVGVVALFGVSATPSYVAVIDAPIRDEAARDRIVTRINAEGVRTDVTAAGVIRVSDEATARRMRTILIREDLIPRGVNPWEIFDRERWTITDMERNVNMQRAQTRMITDHIRSIEGVDNANVIIVWPRDRLFGADQHPVTASVAITPTPGSDITRNRQAIEGIQRLLRLAVEGLRDESIVITDHAGLILNDFANMAAMDRLNITERELALVRRESDRLRNQILLELGGVFSPERVRVPNVAIVMDMSVQTVSVVEHFPFVERPRTPGLPFDDSVIRAYVPRSFSRSETGWEGTGFNPEGPPGVEGQTPPAFRDMSNLFGRMTQVTDVVNHEINVRETQEERSPQIERVSLSVALDGTWNRVYDERGNPVINPNGTIKREYTPVPEYQLQRLANIVRGAIGYNAARGDTVFIENIPFDRTREFAEEDAAFFRQRQIQTTIVVFLSGLALLLVGFIIFRVIAREMERRRRLAEEERARREQALRESAMAEAEQDGLDVSISVEERGRMELMESVVNLAKEHPEDCAQLIRTWLLEE